MPTVTFKVSQTHDINNMQRVAVIKAIRALTHYDLKTSKNISDDLRERGKESKAIEMVPMLEGPRLHQIAALAVNGIEAVISQDIVAELRKLITLALEAENDEMAEDLMKVFIKHK